MFGGQVNPVITVTTTTTIIMINVHINFCLQDIFGEVQFFICGRPRQKESVYAYDREWRLKQQFCIGISFNYLLVKAKFDEHIALFKLRLRHKGYPDNLLNMTPSKVNFSQRMSALQNCRKKTKKKQRAKEYHPSMPDLKNILMNNCILYKTSPY